MIYVAWFTISLRSFAWLDISFFHSFFVGHWVGISQEIYSAFVESWPPNSCQWCKQTKCSGRDFKKHFTKANRRSCWMMGVGWQKGACQFAGGNYEPCVCICVVTGRNQGGSGLDGNTNLQNIGKRIVVAGV